MLPLLNDPIGSVNVPSVPPAHVPPAQTAGHSSRVERGSLTLQHDKRQPVLTLQCAGLSRRSLITKLDYENLGV
jgi:hypothetical protein